MDICINVRWLISIIDGLLLFCFVLVLSAVLIALY